MRPKQVTDMPSMHHRCILYVISSKSGQHVGRLSTDTVGSDSLPLPVNHMISLLCFTYNGSSFFIAKEMPSQGKAQFRRQTFHESNLTP